MKGHLRRLLAAVCVAALLIGSASALTLEQAADLLKEYYVDDLPAGAYRATTVDELFAALGDPYTYYMDAEEYATFLESVEGVAQVGIGVSITYAETGVYINSVLPGGSAEEAGLAAGDTIVAIDGVSCVPSQESDVSRIKGEEGTAVTLTVLHPDGRREDYTLVRRPFTVPTTTASLLENGLGYIDCDTFASTTGTSFAEGVAEYGDRTDLWLVDLRGNPGGRTDGAVNAAGVFIGPGFFLFLRDRAGNYYPSLSFQADLTSDPAVVLTDGYSASASEVFASAVKEYGAGVVVGGRTFGKGVAQIVLDETTDPDLFDGDAVKITAYRFYTGAGNTTDSVGVLPTLLLPDGMVNDVALLLRSGEPQDKTGWLKLTLGGWSFYVDAASAKQDEADSAVLSALFSALPSGEVAGVYADGAWTAMTAPQAAQALGVTYYSRWFGDVEGSPYADALNTLATYGLLFGMDDGGFHPGASLTRAQLCAMLAQTLGVYSNVSTPFSDVPQGMWYTAPVAAMYSLGLVSGRDDGTFGPNDPLAQQELVTVLGRLARFLNTNCYELVKDPGAEALSDPAVARFPDWAQVSAWLLGRAYVETDTGAVHSMLHAPLEEIDPNAMVLRGEAGASLYGVLTTLGLLSY